MQGDDKLGCKAVTSAVWRNHFASGRTPPVHLLARDYALGTFLYAQAAGQLSHEVNIAAAEARFSSPWPLEEVTEESLKEYRKNGYGDDIYSSTEEYGDFGTYTLRAWLYDFVDVSRRLVGQTTPRLYLRWEVDFRGKAEEAQLGGRLHVGRQLV